MLYLMRKIGESIIINDNIEVKLVEVKGKTVKLGFESPPGVTIMRKEIQDRIIAENMAAAKSHSVHDSLDAMGQLKLSPQSKLPES